MEKINRQILLRIAFSAGVLTIIAIAIFLDPFDEARVYAQKGDGGTTITEVTLRNGVRCAVMDSRGGSKGLDCDWFGSRVKPTQNDPKGDGGTTITLVSLHSGRQCAVMDSREGGAISCNFVRSQS